MYSTYDYSNTTAQVSPSINELLCHRECFITQLPSADTQHVMEKRKSLVSLTSR